MEKQVSAKVDEIKDEILELTNYLYENPEIALEEHKAAKKLSGYLREKGFEVENNLAGMDTAFKATKKNGMGPKVAIIAEYDALPGAGHACGHHLIGSIGVGAGVALAYVLDTYEGEVSVIGTPAEETGEGKAHLVDKGVFDDFDAAMMIHPHSSTCVSPGLIGIGGLDFTFKGRPTHAGASPYNGINALDAVILFFNNLNALREQLKDGTRIHGIILEGGTAVNIIPDRGVVRLEVRSGDMDYFDEVLEKVKNCARAAALATGCELDFEHFEPTCESLKENPVLIEVFKETMAKFNILDDGPQLSGGASDIGNVSQVIPSIHPFLKFMEDETINAHTQEFVDASILPYAQDMNIISAKILAITGLALFEKPELIDEMKKAHEMK